jgi:dynein heavy chain
MQLYHEQRDNPPVGYNMPPISGRVLWAHQLLKHMEQPMELFKLHGKLLHTAHGKIVVKKYNKIALILTEYELVGYNDWVKIVESTCNNLQAS